MVINVVTTCCVLSEEENLETMEKHKEQHIICELTHCRDH